MRRGHSLPQPLRFPVAAASREIMVWQGVERTEGRAEWIPTSSPSQCPGDATLSSCPSESLSLQGPRELLFIHLLLLLVDPGVGNGISPVERRDSVVGMAETVPAGAWLSVPRDSRRETCWLSPTPKAASVPQLGPSTQQLQKRGVAPSGQPGLDSQNLRAPATPGTSLPRALT